MIHWLNWQLFLKILLVYSRLIVFSFSDSNIWYYFLYFVVTVITAAFHAQIFFNCSNSLWWMSKWYLSFAPSLNCDAASQIEIMKQCTAQNIFQQMTMLLTHFDLSQSRHTWHWYIVNIAEFYPLFLISFLNFSYWIARWTFEHGGIILIHDLRQLNLISQRTE